MVGERRPIGRPRKDTSKLVTHRSPAMVGAGPSGGQVSVVPIKVEFDAADVSGSGGSAPPTNNLATPTLLVQNMNLSSYQQQQPTRLGAVSNFSVVGSLGSLGGNIYVSSNHGIQNTPTQHAPTTTTVTTNVIQSVVTPPHPDPAGAESAVSNKLTPTPPTLQVYVASPDHQDPQPVPTGFPGAPGPSPPTTTTTNPDASSSSQGPPPPGTVTHEGGALPITKRRGRRKKSPVSLSDSAKRRRGRPKGSGVKGTGTAGMGRKPGRKSRVPSHTRYTNILPHPNMVGKGPSIPGVSSEHVGGGVAGISYGQVLPGGDGAAAVASIGGVVSVEDAGQGLGVVDDGVAGGVASSKDVAVAAANCSAALSLGTRKASVACSVL